MLLTPFMLFKHTIHIGIGMLEKAIDDLVWTGRMDSFLRVDEYEKFIDTIPWFAKHQFRHEDVRNYTDLKRKEHDMIVQKLTRIRDFISDQGMKSSLDPLIAHHSKLSCSYDNVAFSSLITTIKSR